MVIVIVVVSLELKCMHVVTIKRGAGGGSGHRSQRFKTQNHKSQSFHPGGGGTLKFSVYIGEADFFGVKILNFRIFLGFHKN